LKSNKIVIFSILFSIIIVLALILSIDGKSNVKNIVHDKQKKEKKELFKDKLSSDIDIKKTNIKKKQRDNAKNTKKDTKKNDLNNNYILVPFQEIDVSDVDTIKKIDGVEPIGGVLIEKGKISSAQVGDVIYTPLLKGDIFEVKITDRTVNKNKSVSVSGNLVEDSMFGATFTESKKSAFATISTPNGTYEVEAIDGKGYVYTDHDLAKRINPKIKDYIEVN